MAATSTYGFRYPSLADPPNGPQGVQNLAVDVETELNRQGIVGRNSRSSTLGVPFSGNGVLQRVMSTSAPVRSGRSYRVSSHAELYTDGGTIVVQAELRYTVDGSEPSVSSTLLNRWLGRVVVNDIPITLSPSGIYTPSSGGLLRVVLCVLVFDLGGPDGSYEVGGLAGYPAELVIEDVGQTRATSGTIYT